MALSKRIGFKKLYIGFVGIILLALGNFILNYVSAKENISSMQEMNSKIDPYVQKLNELKDVITISKLYTTSWVFLPKNEEDKTRLKEIRDRVYPEIRAEILEFIEVYPELDAEDSISTILSGFDKIVGNQGEIMMMLNDFSTYEEGSIAPAMAQDLLEFEVLPESKALLDKLSQTVEFREDMATSLGEEIDKSLKTMLTLVPMGSVLILVIVALSIFYIHKYIAMPVVKVQRVLGEMSYGKFVPIDGIGGDGVIKEMVNALRTLNRSFENTTAFAVKIGKGLFSTTYEPLSEEDQLGKALMEMKDSLHTYSTEMEIKVEERTKELKKALDDLKSTQSQLIQAEKMASLGQLIASVAHEVNTPIGAINASIGAIKDSLDRTAQDLPKIHDLLSSEEIKTFEKLVTAASSNSETVLSSREERKIKKELRSYFEDQGFDDPKQLASQFADIGVSTDLEQYHNLIKMEHASFVLKTAYYLILQKKSCTNIDLAVKKASKVVFALKTYSRKEGEEEQVSTDISATIETVVTLYKNSFKQGVEIHRDYEETPEIMCYIDELGQVWTNLITNAVHAMDSKGDLYIGIKNQPESITVSIRDTGTGIPEDKLKEIFTPFYTTKKQGEGTGLGLDIVQTIVEKHGGKIEVDSQLEVGTTFTVTLPKNI